MEPRSYRRIFPYLRSESKWSDPYYIGSAKYDDQCDSFRRQLGGRSEFGWRGLFPFAHLSRKQQQGGCLYHFPSPSPFSILPPLSISFFVSLVAFLLPPISLFLSTLLFPLPSLFRIAKFSFTELLALSGTTADFFGMNFYFNFNYTGQSVTNGTGILSLKDFPDTGMAYTIEIYPFPL